MATKSKHEIALEALLTDPDSLVRLRAAALLERIAGRRDRRKRRDDKPPVNSDFEKVRALEK